MSKLNEHMTRQLLTTKIINLKKNIESIEKLLRSSDEAVVKQYPLFIRAVESFELNSLTLRVHAAARLRQAQEQYKRSKPQRTVNPDDPYVGQVRRKEGH